MTDDPAHMERRPIPDPTVLTTQQLLGAIASLKELVMQRLDGMDKASAKSEKLFRAEITALRDVQNQKFKSIQVQFRERQINIAAEIAAGKEAVNKAEEATTKQSDEQARRIDATRDGLTDKIEDIKSRLNLREGKGSGMEASWGILVAVVGMVIGVAGVIVAVVTR